MDSWGFGQLGRLVSIDPEQNQGEYRSAETVGRAVNTDQIEHDVSDEHAGRLDRPTRRSDDRPWTQTDPAGISVLPLPDGYGARCTAPVSRDAPQTTVVTNIEPPISAPTARSPWAAEHH